MKNKILSNYQDFKDYFDKFSDRENRGSASIRETYSEDFFLYNSLAVIHTSGHYVADEIIENIRFSEEEVKIKYRVRNRNGLTALVGYFIIVEVPETVKDIDVQRIDD